MSTTALPPLAERLTLLREDAGLSKRELASRLGVSRTTVRDAELGRDPRHSTLLAYLETFPEIEPTDLFAAGQHRTPPADRRCWNLLAHSMGYRVRKMQLSLALDDEKRLHRHLTLTGVKSELGDITDTSVRVNLMRTVCTGSSRILASIRAEPADLKGRTVELEDGEVVHVFRFPENLKRRGLEYERREVRADSSLAIESVVTPNQLVTGAAAVGIDHPVEVLEIVWKLPGRDRLRPLPHAWPTALVPRDDTSSFELLHPVLLPGRRLESKGARLRLRVERPPIACSYALGFMPRGEDDQGEDEIVESTGSGIPELGEVLRSAREAARLSLRGMAAEVGTGAMTIRDGEHGSDLRHSTLSGYLGALSGLSPRALFPQRSETLPERRSAWQHQRDLFGCSVDEEVKTVRIGTDGSSKIRISAQQLRRTRGEASADFVVRLGLGRTVIQASRASLDSIDAGNARSVPDLRISRVPGPDGPPVHQLTVPAEHADTGVSFGRRMIHAGVFAMTAGRARELTGADGPFEEGTTVGPLLPTRRLILEVRFPKGYWPDGIRCHAWSLVQVPDPESLGLAERLHPEGLDLLCEKRRRLVSLSVDYPLVGFKYALEWTLPE
ncbi:MAG: helix-turn-helix transcriptional regulator [Acidobacteriota bacterium]